jgi:hypothetical protein
MVPGHPFNEMKPNSGADVMELGRKKFLLETPICAKPR